MADETEKEHLARHAGRKAAGDKRQKATEDRADKSEIRADESESRADSAQMQQEFTDQITTAHTDQLLVMEEEQTKQTDAFSHIIEGVDLLAIQVGTLNERVYTKTFLDKTRNRLLLFSVVAFVVLSFILSGFAVVVLVGNRDERDRAADRASEATEFRHQLADCQLSPGTVLKDGFVNPGNCYIQNEDRTGDILSSAIGRISNGISTSQDCLYLRGQGLRPEPCAEINALVDSFKGGVNPFPPPSPLPGKPTTTTTTTLSINSGVAAPPKAVTPTTTTTRAVSMPTTTPTTTPDISRLLCGILSLVRLCDA